MNPPGYSMRCLQFIQYNLETFGAGARNAYSVETVPINSTSRRTSRHPRASYSPGALMGDLKMTTAPTDEPTLRKPLRLWPGVVLVILQWLVRFVLPVVAPGTMQIAVLGGVAGGLAVVLWWLFFSRAPWSERLGAVVVMIAALFATSRIPGLLHESIATGAMGMLFFVLAIPVLSLALVAWAVASRRLADGPRRAALVAAILLACGVWTLVRTGGFTADFENDFAWRWSETPEERLLAQAGDEPVAVPGAGAALAAAKTPEEPLAAQARDEPAAPPPASEAAETAEEPLVAQAGDEPAAAPGDAPAPARAERGADWPGFRGSGRDGNVRGVWIETTSEVWSSTSSGIEFGTYGS